MSSSDEEQESRSITIRIKDEDGQVTSLSVKRTTLLYNLLKDYCEQQGIEKNVFQFKFEGSRLTGREHYQQLENLGVADNAILECVTARAMVTVRAEDGEEMKCQVKKSSQLSRVFKAFAKAKGIESSDSMQFAYNGMALDDGALVGSLGFMLDDEFTIDCYLPAKNARHFIEELLAAETCPGLYSTGSEITGVPVPSVEIVLQNENGDMTGQKKLLFPLDANGISDIKKNAERAGVGLPDRTVVNLDVRKTWQIKPRKLRVSNVEPALEAALQKVSTDFGLNGDYTVEASLYKLLMYEPGCFFLRHRDNERLDNMFATLVLELPSEYQGAELSVYSPLTPNEKTTYTFTGTSVNARPKRRTRSNKPGLHFAAFYADCYHEVNELTTGHRVALVYHLTAAANPQRSLYCGVSSTWRKWAASHLPSLHPAPPQPVDESIALRLSKLIQLFAGEDDEAYPSKDKLGKPTKLAIVLSHHYTPASLDGIHALKGSDRSLAELIRAAAFCPPDDQIPTLARLAAKKAIEMGGQEFAIDPDNIQANHLISEAFKDDGNGPFFDAAISLATVWDSGEGTPCSSECDRDGTSTFVTTGPLLFITQDGESIDLGPKLSQDITPKWHPSFFGKDFGGEESRGPPFEYHGPVDDINGFPLYDFSNGPIVYGEQMAVFDNREQGNHSLPIFSHELLLTSEQSRMQFRNYSHWYHGKHVVVEESPKEIEFLGNGMPYNGRIYSRAVILIWPKVHRTNVQLQSKGGRAVLAKAGGQ